MLAACGGDPPCPETEKTVEHGVYGEVAYKTLAGDHTVLYNVELSLMAVGSQTYINTRSNEDGFYEFEVPAGTGGYSLCSTFANAGCWSFTITTFVRLDLVVEEGQVFWDEAAFGECP